VSVQCFVIHAAYACITHTSVSGVTNSCFNLATVRYRIDAYVSLHDVGDVRSRSTPTVAPTRLRRQPGERRKQPRRRRKQPLGAPPVKLSIRVVIEA